MAKLSSTDEPVTKAELAEFYQQIFPYLGGNKAVDSNPVGHFGFFLLPSAPAGYLECKGQRLSATAFPLLFNALKEFPAATRATWGAGDADWVTEFDLPDMRGEFVRASGTNAHTNQGSGAAVGVHQDATGISSGYSNNSAGGFPHTSAATSTYNYLIDCDLRDSFYTKPRASVSHTDTLKRTTSSGTVEFGTVRSTNTSLLGCVKYTYVTQEVDYSEVERVVGKWVDGSDLYEKVITGTTATANAEGVSTTNISYGSTYNNVMIVGGLLIKSANQFIPLNFPWGLPDGTKTAVATFSKPNELTVKTVAYYAECSFWVKIQYTKPTS